MTPLKLNIIRTGEQKEVLDLNEMHPIQEHKNFPITEAILIEDGTTGINGFTGQTGPKRATVSFVGRTHDGKLVVMETTLRLVNMVLATARGAFPDQVDDLY